MVASIDRELRDLRLALTACRGDRCQEPRLTAALLAHLLLSCPALLQNLLIDTAVRPRRRPAPDGRAAGAADRC